MDGRQSRDGGSRVPWLWNMPVIKKERGGRDGGVCVWGGTHRSQRFPGSGALYSPSSEGVRRQLLLM